MPYYSNFAESRATRARPGSAPIGKAAVHVHNRCSSRPLSGMRRVDVKANSLRPGCCAVESLLRAGSPTFRASSPISDCTIATLSSSKPRPVLSPAAIERLSTPRKREQPSKDVEATFRPKIGIPWGPYDEMLKTSIDDVCTHRAGQIPKIAVNRDVCDHAEHANFYCKICNSLLCPECWKLPCVAARQKMMAMSPRSRIQELCTLANISGWNARALERSTIPFAKRLYPYESRTETQPTQVHGDEATETVEASENLVESAASHATPLERTQERAVETPVSKKSLDTPCSERIWNLAKPRKPKQFEDISYLPTLRRLPDVDEIAIKLLKHTTRAALQEDMASGVEKCSHSHNHNRKRGHWCSTCSRLICDECKAKACPVREAEWKTLDYVKRVSKLYDRGLLRNWEVNALIRSRKPVFERIGTRSYKLDLELEPEPEVETEVKPAEVEVDVVDMEFPATMSAPSQ